MPAALDPVDVLAALLHGEVGGALVQVAHHAGAVEPGLGRLEVVHVEGDAPEHEVHIVADADQRVGTLNQPLTRFGVRDPALHRRPKLGLHLLALGVRQAAEGRVELVEGVTQKLPLGAVGFLLRDLPAGVEVHHPLGAAFGRGDRGARRLHRRSGRRLRLGRGRADWTVFRGHCPYCFTAPGGHFAPSDRSGRTGRRQPPAPAPALRH